MNTASGSGVLNSAITNLPFELHIPGYSFCGPGTRLRERLARGDKPKNKLDSFCKDHDIAYGESTDLKHRHKADRVLEDKAWERVKAKDSTFGEKTAAWLVTNAMKVKRKVGAGRRSTCDKSMCSVVGKIKKHLGRGDVSKKKTLSNLLKAAKKTIQKIGGRKKVKVPRVIPLPKTGGILPLIPIFAGLSAIGALSGGAAGIAKAVNDVQTAKDKLKESKRHNETMEAIALGKKGSGLYLKKYKKGYGLYLKKMSKNFQ